MADNDAGYHADLPTCGRALRLTLFLLFVTPALAISTPAQADAGFPRPRYHFTPPQNFMNDPNGLVFFRGNWHLFYQHNPEGPTWGHMSWGHAQSRDLVHWQHLPIALREEAGIMIFSGSAVVDQHNTTGLCKTKEPCLIAVYTGHRNDRQTQNLAFSQDGVHFEKFSGNPVLDIGQKDFRDPKVFWHEKSKSWIMVVAWPAVHQIRIYRSRDLIHWAHASDFGPSGTTQGIWECPDLFPLSTSKGERWVMLVNLNPGGPAGGSGGQYFVGRFDGSTFVEETPRKTPRWIDYGKDAYATVTFADVPARDGRRIALSWASNWEYTNQEPTGDFRGAMSIPKVLSLRWDKGDWFLHQAPPAELAKIRGVRTTMPPGRLDRATGLAGFAQASFELQAKIEPRTADTVTIELRGPGTEVTTIGYDTKTASLFVDRSQSGVVNFHPKFAGRHSAPLLLDSGNLHLQILVDTTSVEVFAAQGRVVLSDRIFPAAGSRQVVVTGAGAMVHRLEAWPLAAP